MSSCGGLSLAFETWEGTDLGLAEAKDYFLNPPSYPAGVQRWTSLLGGSALAGPVLVKAAPGIGSALATAAGKTLLEGRPLIRLIPSASVPLVMASSNPVIAEGFGLDPAVVSSLQAFVTAKQGKIASDLIHRDEFVKGKLAQLGFTVDPRKAPKTTQLVTQPTRKAGLTTMSQAKKTVTDLVGDLKEAQQAVKHKKPLKLTVKVPRTTAPTSSRLGSLQTQNMPKPKPRVIELEPFTGKNKPRTTIGQTLRNLQRSGNLRAGAHVFRAGANLPINIAKTAGKFAATAGRGAIDLAKGAARAGPGIVLTGVGAAAGGKVLDAMTDRGYTKDLINLVSGTDITQEQAERHTEDFLETEVPFVGDVGVPLDPFASYAKAGGAVANLQEVNEERGLHEDNILSEAAFVRDSIDDTVLGATPLPELASGVYIAGKGTVNVGKAVGTGAVKTVEGIGKGAKIVTGFIPLTPW